MESFHEKYQENVAGHILSFNHGFEEKSVFEL